MLPSSKPLVWVGSSREDLKAFPEEVRHVMGYALYLAQVGGKHPDAKPLRGFGGGRVLEVVDDHDGDTYRAVYTVKLRGAVYALHAFQKKSKKGINTATRPGSREAAAQAGGGDPRQERFAVERRRQ
jgi:phage-related protein